MYTGHLRHHAEAVPQGSRSIQNTFHGWKVLNFVIFPGKRSSSCFFFYIRLSWDTVIMTGLLPLTSAFHVKLNLEIHRKFSLWPYHFFWNDKPVEYNDVNKFHNKVNKNLKFFPLYGGNKSILALTIVRLWHDTLSFSRKKKSIKWKIR